MENHLKQQAAKYFKEAEKWAEQGNHSKALPLFQKAARIFKTEHTTLEYINTQVEVCNNLMHLSRLEEMNEILQTILKQVLALPPSPKQQIALANIYNSLSVYHFHFTQVKEAENFSKKAIDIHQKVLPSNDLLWADSYSNLASCKTYKGYYQEAFDYFRKSLETLLTHHTKPHIKVGGAYNNLGWNLTQSGDYLQAEAYFKKALHVFVQIFNQTNEYIAICYNNIAYCSLQNYDYEEALKNFNHSLSIRMKIHGEIHSEIAKIYKNISITYVGVGNEQKAAFFRQKALKVYQQLYGEQHLSMSLAYMTLGYDLSVQKKWKEAIVFFEQAHSIRTKLLGQKHPSVGEVHINIANCFKSQKQFKKALEHYQMALISLCSSFADSNIYTNPHTLHDYTPAMFLNRTLYRKAETFHQLYSKHHQIKDLKAAYETYQVAIQFIDSLRQNYQAEGSKLILLRNTLPVYEGAIEAALMLYQKTSDSKYLEQAFGFSEKSKALILLSNLTEAAAKIAAHIPDKLLQKEKQLKNERSALDTKIRQEKLKQSQVNETLIREWQVQYFDLDQAYQQLIAHFETTYPEYHQLKYQIQTPKTKDIQQFLSPSTLLIEYFVGEQNIYIFVLSKTSLHLKKIKKPDDFERLVNNFQRSIDTGALQRFVKISSQLYNYLVKNIQSQVNDSKRLIIIADDQLHRLSFEALINATQITEINYAQLPYLISTHEVSYQYSAALWFHTYHKHQQTALLEDSFFGIAPVHFGEKKSNAKGYIVQNQQKLPSNFNFNHQKIKTSQRSKVVLKSELNPNTPLTDLDATEAEVRDIYTLFSDKELHATALFYNHASKKNLQQYISHSKYVLLSTHGFVNKEMPLLSGLYLHQNFTSDPNNLDFNDESHKLYISETYHLRLSADLVVLSSCESGIGNLHKGEGMIALNRGFLYAGASNVIYSLFKIPQEASSQIVRTLFQEILEHQTNYTTALRKAKLQLIKENREMRDWAGFAILGV